MSSRENPDHGNGNIVMIFLIHQGGPKPAGDFFHHDPGQAGLGGINNRFWIQSQHDRLGLGPQDFARQRLDLIKKAKKHQQKTSGQREDGLKDRGRIPPELFRQFFLGLQDFWPPQFFGQMIPVSLPDLFFRPFTHRVSVSPFLELKICAIFLRA